MVREVSEPGRRDGQLIIGRDILDCGMKLFCSWGLIRGSLLSWLQELALGPAASDGSMSEILRYLQVAGIQGLQSPSDPGVNCPLKWI